MLNLSPDATATHYFDKEHLNVVEQSQQKQRELEEKALMLDDMPHLEVAYSTGDPKTEESYGVQQGETTLKNNASVEDLSDDLELLALDLVRSDHLYLKKILKINVF